MTSVHFKKDFVKRVLGCKSNENQIKMLVKKGTLDGNNFKNGFYFSNTKLC
jgi:hypothetical protein